MTCKSLPQNTAWTLLPPALYSQQMMSGGAGCCVDAVAGSLCLTASSADFTRACQPYYNTYWSTQRSRPQAVARGSRRHCSQSMLPFLLSHSTSQCFHTQHATSARTVCRAWRPLHTFPASAFGVCWTRLEVNHVNTLTFWHYTSGGTAA